MMIREGQGFVIQTAQDSPWAGWFSVQELDWVNLIRTNPSMFLRCLGEIVAFLPGGVSILWNAAETSRQSSPALLTTLENILLHLPGVNLHIKKPLRYDQIEVPLNAWFHSPEAPDGDLAAAWRKGLIGWVPQQNSGWSLPGIGHASTDQKDCSAGMLWGEVTIPASAVHHLEIENLKSALEDTQAHIERVLSHRINAGAWPQSIPFRRRKTTWRLTLTGGWEFQLSGQSWEALALDLSSLQGFLSNQLKCRIHIGINHNARIAGMLGEQAMRLGLPWRNSLSLPPAPPSFTPGISADPRKTSPLEARASIPKSIAALLSDPPVVLLRVPVVPSMKGISAFLRGLEVQPAIRWLPPDMPPPGPFHAEISWDPAATFPAVADGKASHPKLFDWAE
ncbi:MAG: hypothetical protein LBB40_05725 [Holophagales bacterium]|jgi:hypothetical protein|nr:hypothetical protein [Holophagales bacterium]